MTSTYYSRSGPDTLNWGRICGIAFAVTVQASLFMMLLVPPSVEDTSKDEHEVHVATIIEPPPPPPPPPPTPPKEIKIQPKEIPPPPQHVNVPPPPLPPPVVTNTPTPMSTPPPPPTPPAPPVQAVSMEASVDNAFMSAHPPEYPREELAQGVTGTVILQVRVSPDGDALEVTVAKSSHNRNLDRAAVEAAKHYKFRAKMVNGQRVEGLVTFPVSFTL